jgi:hypothetical protein
VGFVESELEVLGVWVVWGVSMKFAGGRADDCGAGGGGVDVDVGAEDIIWKYFGVDEEVIDRGEGGEKRNELENEEAAALCSFLAAADTTT